MATAHPLPPANALTRPPEAAAVESGVEEALTPTFHTPEGALIKLTEPVAQLPVEMEVAVPVRDFRVRNLLNLEPGQVIETQWAHGEDMPLVCGDVQLAWSEFEVVDTQLAVRLTRLM